MKFLAHFFNGLVGDRLNRSNRTIALVGLILNLAACSGSVTWQEEVKLNDGRVIVVTQKKRCESAYTGQNYASCIAREAWLTIPLPEFGSQEIVWHENLDPLVLNVHQGRLYVIGFPPTIREFRQYGRQRPPYFGFLWDGGAWQRIPFSEIPEAIYDTNMLIESIPPNGTELLTLSKKQSYELNGKPEYGPELKRIDPTFRSNLY